MNIKFINFFCSWLFSRFHSLRSASFPVQPILRGRKLKKYRKKENHTENFYVCDAALEYFPFLLAFLLWENLTSLSPTVCAAPCFRLTIKIFSVFNQKFYGTMLNKLKKIVCNYNFCILFFRVNVARLTSLSPLN